MPAPVALIDMELRFPKFTAPANEPLVCTLPEFVVELEVPTIMLPPLMVVALLPPLAVSPAVGAERSGVMLMISVIFTLDWAPEDVTEMEFHSPPSIRPLLVAPVLLTEPLLIEDKEKGLHLRSFVTTTKPQPFSNHNLKSVPLVLTGDKT